MDIFMIFSFLGGLALFLYGMKALGKGLEELSGGKMRDLLARLCSTPLKGVLVGAVVTAAIQSSSATTVMVVGFVNSGLMQLSHAVGVIMGANLGTTITSWVLSLTGIEGDNFFVRLLKPSSLAPLLAFVGIVPIMFSKNAGARRIGGILAGLGILFFGMQMMSDAVAPLSELPEFRRILTLFSNPLAGLVAGIILTAIIQSSSASVGILQALSASGGVTFSSAIPIIMGQNIGTCVTTLLSSIGASKNAKRAAFIHLYFNVIGTAVLLVAFYGLHALVKFDFYSAAVTPFWIAVIHTLFNVVSTVILFPFASFLQKLAELTVGDGRPKRRRQRTQL
ncbi:MAG: Na/Pi cotransporter family protein [Clostridia bacterium]|nr:Na/Pi cotransporter family protein [Clostridia bacterium]